MLPAPEFAEHSPPTKPTFSEHFSMELFNFLSPHVDQITDSLPTDHPLAKQVAMVMSSLRRALPTPTANIVDPLLLQLLYPNKRKALWTDKNASGLIQLAMVTHPSLIEGTWFPYNAILEALPPSMHLMDTSSSAAGSATSGTTSPSSSTANETPSEGEETSHFVLHKDKVSSLHMAPCQEDFIECAMLLAGQAIELFYVYENNRRPR